MDGSDMLSYILYAVLVIVLGVAGWYIGKTYDTGAETSKAMIGAGVGLVVGVGVAWGISAYNQPAGYVY